jgi:hypothetical protein
MTLVSGEDEGIGGSVERGLMIKERILSRIFGPGTTGRSQEGGKLE